mmetsp:Transcript_74113/g.205975  ORF Transcript_74113/g.205975 Transcript_74113/m.205975 type:complete len:407 (+) Transcript_74113:105-1325(+)
MATVLKVTRLGQIHRITFQEAPDYDKVDAAIRSVWPDSGARWAKYFDEEGDACTLAETTFADFLESGVAIRGARVVLKLHLPPSSSAQEFSSVISEPLSAVVEPSDAQEYPRSSAGTSSPLSASWDLLEADGTLSTRLQQIVAREAGDRIQEEEEEDGSGVEPRVSTRATSLASSGVAVFDIHTPAAGPPEAEQLAAARIQRAIRARLLRHVEEVRQQAAVRIQRAFRAYARRRQSASLREWPVQVSTLNSDLSAVDKISIVLAAFDEDGDGRLNYEESNEVQRASWAGTITPEAYRQLCEQVGVAAADGLGLEALVQVYARRGNLDRDFEAAKRKLQADLEVEGGPERATQQGAEATPWRTPAWLASAAATVVLPPLVLGAPLLALPLVLCAVRHQRLARYRRAP